MATAAQAAAELLRRRQARSVFSSWCEYAGYRLMPHHRLIAEKLQEVAESDKPRFVIILVPPGTAKSTYTSKLFVPWYLGRRPGYSILACSYSKDLASTFGRAARNLVEQNEAVLGYSLAKDSKAADEWETSTGGRYFCAGVSAGIAGHRADLGLIDDYLGNQEDADSKLVRDKQWDWFLSDFWPRVSGTQADNDGSVVIIANRRHADDLVGRLTDKLNDHNADAPIPAEKWEVIKLPFFAEANDPLGRQVDEVIWPEKFASKADQVRRLPSRIRAGLYQQNPRAEDGNYFKASWLKGTGYEPQDLPTNLRIYTASDHACSDGRGDSTVLLSGGWDGRFLWILPDCWWEQADTGEVVKAMLRINRRNNPLTWWAEKGHISKSIGPFLKEKMQETANYIRIEEVTPVRAKDVRARTAQGMMELGMIRFPKFAPWWAKAEDQLLSFPGGSHDDFIDVLAHLCRGVHRFIVPDKAVVEVREEVDVFARPLTLARLRADEQRESRRLAYAKR